MLVPPSAEEDDSLDSRADSLISYNDEYARPTFIVDDIDTLGVVHLLFSESMSSISNLTLFNSSSLKLTIDTVNE